MHRAVEAIIARRVLGQVLGEHAQIAGGNVVDRAGMQPIGVIAVIVVLEHHLPVPREGGFLDVHRGIGLIQFKVFQHLCHLGQSWRQRCGLGVEVDEDEAVPDLHLELGQADLALVEAASLFHRRRPDQLTVQAVGPMVIGAQEGTGIAMAFRHKHRPVLANARHGADMAVAGPHHDDRLAHMHRGEVIARRLHPFLAANTKPFPGKNRVLLKLEKTRVRVARWRQHLRLVNRTNRALQALKKCVRPYIGHRFRPLKPAG